MMQPLLMVGGFWALVIGAASASSFPEDVGGLIAICGFLCMLLGSLDA